MNLIEKTFAFAIVAACLVLLLRLALSSPRRDRFDAGWRRLIAAVARKGAALRGHRGAEARAGREAGKAIERARRTAAGGEWDGNVYRPKSFKQKKKRDLH
ncbi:MAG: hypothetical protein ABIO71_04580 [Caldimonas sp.]